MVSTVTNGVKVTVETFYQNEYSSPIQHEFMFAYRIKITNNNPFVIKLSFRHWDIFDSDGSVRNIEGDGVVGMQPVIEEGQTYEYVSGAIIHSEIGRMVGYYLMTRMKTKEQFIVNIPAFSLVAPFKLN